MTGQNQPNQFSANRIPNPSDVFPEVAKDPITGLYYIQDPTMQQQPQMQQPHVQPQMTPNYGQQYPVPGQPVAPAYVAAPYNQKSKMVAALLAFFAGCLGVHHFYMGRIGLGVIQLSLNVVAIVLALTIVGLLVALPIWSALALWVFIEFILILVGEGMYGRDSEGVPLR